MSGIKKLFASKPNTIEIEQAQRYELINSNCLLLMTKEELIRIIYRYNKELKTLNSKIEDLTFKLSTCQSQTTVLTEEVNLHKKQNKILNQEIYEGSVALNEYKSSLEVLREQLESSKSQLNSNSKCLLAVPPSRSQETIGTSDFEQERQLRSKLRDYEIMDQKLNITIKLLETEIDKLNITIQQMKTEGNHKDDKITSLETSLRNIKFSLNKRNIDYENEKDQKNILVLQKDEIESELKTTNEELLKKDEEIYKLQKKQEDLETKIQEISELKHSLEKTTYEHTSQLDEVEEKHKIHISVISENYENVIAQLKEKIYQLSQNPQERLEVENSSSFEDIGQFNTENIELKKLVSNKDEKIKQLMKALVDSKQKQKYLENEIAKIKQKILETPSIHKEEFSSRPRSLTSSEISNLKLFSVELDGIYKFIINAYSSSNSKIQIPISEFTEFEKKMSNLLMQVHEAIDSSNELLRNPVPERNRRKYSINRSSLKLFSCVKTRGDNNNWASFSQKKDLRYTTGTIVSKHNYSECNKYQVA